jgi:uncharacterized phage protein (TIGR02216 family)
VSENSPGEPAAGPSQFGDSAVQLAGIAAAVLAWRPDEFWRSTPAELACALGAGRGGDAEIGRSDLDRLLTKFPDERTG